MHGTEGKIIENDKESKTFLKKHTCTRWTLQGSSLFVILIRHSWLIWVLRENKRKKGSNLTRDLKEMV